MHWLVDGPPEWAKAAGERYPVRSDYRVGVLFEQLMLDESLSPAVRAACALRLYYPDPPKDADAALAGILWFWNCGRAPAGGGEGTGQDGGRVFDFEADAGLICAAFWADYGLDLCRERLHWWKFCAMLRALKPENLFCRVLAWRGADLAALSGEERAFTEKMQRLYALPLPQGEAERRSAIEKALATSGDVRRILEG